MEDLARLLRERIRASLAYRERVVTDSNAYRLIFSEADFLPGLIVDRYNDLLSFQVLTQAMDAEHVRATFVSELKDTLSPAAIVERVEPKIRQLEQLPARSSALVMGEKSSTIFGMNGVQFHYEALEGQKTGAFLDQRENYAAAAQYARGEALDAPQGGKKQGLEAATQRLVAMRQPGKVVCGMGVLMGRNRLRETGSHGLKGLRLSEPMGKKMHART